MNTTKSIMNYMANKNITYERKHQNEREQAYLQENKFL